jgi:hypothetical protein
MPTQSASIAVLLAGVFCRLVTHYAVGQLRGTLMRHVLPPVPVVGRAGGVVEATDPAPLMLPPGLPLLLPARGRGARPRAVPLAPVAAPADEEDLPAVRPVADDEAQRVHGSGRDRQELDAIPDPCDEGLVDPGSGCAT